MKTLHEWHGRLIVFTDLDGTLLDHATYSHAAAAPALHALSQLGVPLILASSKTAPEMLPLHAALGLGDTPIIVENGAARVTPGDTLGAHGDYDRLRTILSELPQDLRAPYRGFGDMTDAQVAQITGLNPEGAGLARQRSFTEPGLWSGSDAGQRAFLAALEARGVTARSGGRFLTLSFGGTKAGQMQGIMGDLGRDIAIALGDAPNDIEMIETATRGVIIRNDHGKGIAPLSGEAEGRILRTTLPGPEGWNAAILGLLDQPALMQGHD
ncbi:HAD-IIB family hydrolase [Salipiger pallidus]|nr:HAD-IIB family hydrolase [Salipiger pallidus]